MASRKPLRAKNHSRRAFLRSVAVGGAVVAGGVANLPSATAETVGAPSIPDQFDTEAWKRRDLGIGEDKEGGFTWNGIALNNVELAEKVETEAGYSEPLWQLYKWKLDAPHEGYAGDGPSKEDSSWWPSLEDVKSVSLGINGGIFSASVELSNLGGGSEGVELKRGKKALEIYGDQVESDFPFTSVTSCEGLTNDEYWGCTGTTDISYSAPSSVVEEKYTIHQEYSTDEFKVNYRGLFVLQTFDESESFVISGAVFPDSKVDKKWSLSDYGFDMNFVDESLPFIKEAGSSP